MAKRRKRTGGETFIGQRSDLRKKHTASQVLSAAEARSGRGESSGIMQKERIRRTGLGVSVKFALAVSTAIAVFMVLFGLVIFNSVKGALNEEIDSAGIMAARALSTHDVFAWSEFNRAYAGTTYARFEEAIASGEKKIPERAISEGEEHVATKRREYNKNLLSRFLEKDQRILDAVIWNPDRTKIIQGPKRLEFAGNRAYGRYNVDVEYGTYTTADGTSLRARSFSAPILGVSGALEGKATVVLSEGSIQEQLKKVRLQILVLALVFIALGVGVSFIMGRQITSPILSLTKDVEVIARGKLDHHPRVQTRDEIGVLARTVDLMGRSLKDAQEQQFEHEKQQHQLAVALEVQENLFPEKLPGIETYEMEAHYQPGPEVGGDYYDAFTLPDGRVCVMVASASGKGIPAAMVTIMARSFITSVAERESSGAEILKTVNRLLSPDLRRGMYVTCLFCILDPASGKVEISNAGHNPLVLYRHEKKGVAAIHSDGIALGFDKGPVFDHTLAPKEVMLEVGDRIVLCTPGVFGLQNHDGKELGEENFYRLVAREGDKNSSAFVSLVSLALEKYTEGGSVESDITYFTVKRLV